MTLTECMPSITFSRLCWPLMKYSCAICHSFLLFFAGNHRHTSYLENRHHGDPRGSKTPAIFFLLPLPFPFFLLFLFFLHFLFGFTSALLHFCTSFRNPAINCPNVPYIKDKSVKRKKTKEKQKKKKTGGKTYGQRKRQILSLPCISL